MKHVTFMIADGVVKPSGLFGAIEIFEKANEFHLGREGLPFYEVQLAGTNLKQTLLNGSFHLNVTALEDISKTDLVVLPGFEVQDEYAVKTSKKALDWVVRQYQMGAEVASLCTGAFQLAATGLLEGKPCATHWKAEANFRQLFPELDLHTHLIITDQQGIYTAGGAVSSLNLPLYLVEKYSGREAAIYCAKVLQIDIDRNSQSVFILFEGLKDHKDESILTIQDYIEAHIGDRLTIEQLAEKSSMDRINFSRRFKRATQLSPADYIQRIKVEAAKRQLESTQKQINEVMYGVGYVDIKNFRRAFKRVAGMTPGEYRNKFNRKANEFEGNS